MMFEAQPHYVAVVFNRPASPDNIAPSASNQMTHISNRLEERPMA
ncbi:hypothetical protein [Phytoactinopolyspora endophytica]|nr:hypothetical protein [Phytoactinopolyspora endophytica]